MKAKRRFILNTLFAVTLLVALAPATAPVAATGPAGNWALTGYMSTSREKHTATLLNDGKVLVTGGQATGRVNQTSAEIYDPATGAWTSAGDMSVARTGHAAARLLDGRVLVTGGFYYIAPPTGNTNWASAEIYTPGSGWSEATDMSTPRYYHNATTLADGRVLVSGGANVGVLSSCEIYDPSSNTWSPTGNLLASTYEHQAVLLKWQGAGGRGKHVKRTPDLRSGHRYVERGGNHDHHALSPHGHAAAGWQGAGGWRVSDRPHLS